MTPFAPLRYCAAPNCPAKVARGFCADHQRLSPASEHGVYRTQRWRRLRLAVLADEPFCVEPGCRLLAAEVHHKQHRNVAPHLFWERSNLEGLCHAHHAERTRRGE